MLSVADIPHAMKRVAVAGRLMLAEAGNHMLAIAAGKRPLCVAVSLVPHSQL
jgi:hypothetical protein